MNLQGADAVVQSGEEYKNYVFNLKLLDYCSRKPSYVSPKADL